MTNPNEMTNEEKYMRAQKLKDQEEGFWIGCQALRNGGYYKNNGVWMDSVNQLPIPDWYVKIIEKYLIPLVEKYPVDSEDAYYIPENW